MITISVIIPVYNAEEYITDALKSIDKQTEKVDEIIVVNDGSTDGTAEVVKREYPEVQLIEQKNAGPSAARNTGIKAAKFQYVTFLDADDLWHRDMIKVQKAFFNAHPDIKWWVANHSRNNWENVWNEKRFPAIMNDPLTCYIDGLLFVSDAISIKKDILLGDLGLFDESLVYGEDNDMRYRLMMHYDRCGYENKSLALYRDVNEKSLTSIWDEKEVENVLLKTFYEKRNIPDEKRNKIDKLFSIKIKKAYRLALVHGKMEKVNQILKEAMRYKLDFYNGMERIGVQFIAALVRLYNRVSDKNLEI